MSKLEIEQFACLSDNYAVLIHDAESGLTASIDAPDAKAILEGFLRKHEGTEAVERRGGQHGRSPSWSACS
jgi:hypothetical protein